MISKRGALLHWIMFAILASLGLFLLLLSRATLSQEAKGQWTVDFVKEYAYRAEIKLLELDSKALSAAEETALSLAQNAGFQQDSLCGKNNGVNLWNKQEQFCIPSVQDEAVSALLERLAGERYSEVIITGEKIIGDGPLRRIRNLGGYTRLYSYDPGFDINLQYTFEEYAVIEAEARQLLSKCRQKRNLPSCLNGKPSNWGICENGINERIVSFCIDSPSKTIFQEQSMVYKIALDFTPLEALAIEDVIVTKIDTGYEIRFPRDDSAEKYTLYYTNWPAVESKSGNVDDVFEDFSEVFYFRKEVALHNPSIEDCPAVRISRIVFRCGNTLYYIVDNDSFLAGETYYFAVTATIDGKESAIASFVKA